MRLRSCVTLIAIAFPLVLGSRPTQAAPADKQLARRHFARGKRHFLAGEYAKAVRAFEQAYHHRPHRVILFNIALAQARRGKALAAATQLRLYLQQAHPSDPPLPAELRRIQRRVGVLWVRVKNPLARIYIDGRFVGVGSAVLVVRPGQSAVVVKLGLRVLARKILRITAGKKHLWDLPDADATTSTTTAESTGASPAPGATTPPSGGWRRFRRLHWGYFTATTGATVSLLIAAIATSVQARSLHDDYAADPTNTALRDQGQRTQRVSNALWGVTVASAVAAAVVAIFTRWKPAERAQRFALRPTLGLGQAGLSLHRWH